MKIQGYRSYFFVSRSAFRYGMFIHNGSFKKKYIRIRKISALKGYQFDRHDQYLNLRRVLIFGIGVNIIFANVRHDFERNELWQSELSIRCKNLLKLVVQFCANTSAFNTNISTLPFYSDTSKKRDCNLNNSENCIFTLQFKRLE